MITTKEKITKLIETFHNAKLSSAKAFYSKAGVSGIVFSLEDSCVLAAHLNLGTQGCEVECDPDKLSEIIESIK
jgi:hypothetical protein